MATVIRDILPVPGARIYHEVRGSGPVLLIIPTGNGDAAPFGVMADALAAHRTVITYDRRGFSRSPADGPVDDDRRMAQDVSDAVRLLDHLADGPAEVFGTCSGGIVALSLLERHPARVRTLVAHEPPLASVLPDADHWDAFHSALYDLYRTSGAAAAKNSFKEHLGMTQTRPPQGAELPPRQLAEMLERLRRNEVFWFEHEMRSYPNHVLDMKALAAAADRLVLAGGKESHDFFPYRPALVMSEHFGIPVEQFPGGHLGHVTHPYECAEKLAGLLASRTT
jgi:acetyltransferase/esterase